MTKYNRREEYWRFYDRTVVAEAVHLRRALIRLVRERPCPWSETGAGPWQGPIRTPTKPHHASFYWAGGLCPGRLSIFVDAFLRAPVCTRNMGSFGPGRCPLRSAHVRPYTCSASNASGVMNAR